MAEGDMIKRTACGLYVIDGCNPRSWPNFTWVTDVIDVEGDQENFDAFSLIERELIESVGENSRTHDAVMPIGVAFAALHDFTAPRVPHRNMGLEFADPSVPDYMIQDDKELNQFTVCGVLENSWTPVSWQTEADHPLVAYYRVWNACRMEFGEHMLLAGVHYGDIPEVSNIAYAYPWAKNDSEMADVAREKWNIR